ncbi:hypothetical protein M3Y96_00158000 [Aphelenchoides besseyi]|nr:hypothetical protein M3Y96_00158000 [Aphelenchoides besseyi]
MLEKLRNPRSPVPRPQRIAGRARALADRYMNSRVLRASCCITSDHLTPYANSDPRFFPPPNFVSQRQSTLSRDIPPPELTPTGIGVVEDALTISRRVVPVMNFTSHATANAISTGQWGGAESPYAPTSSRSSTACAKSAELDEPTKATVHGQHHRDIKRPTKAQFELPVCSRPHFLTTSSENPWS